MPDAPAPSLADVFAAVAALARVLTGGRPLTELRLVYADDRGRGGSIPVPFDAAVEGDESDDPAAVTASKQRILDVLAASDIPLSRKQIAMRLKLKTTSGRYGTDVPELIESRQVLEREQLLTDDAKKYGDTS